MRILPLSIFFASVLTFICNGQAQASNPSETSPTPAAPVVGTTGYVFAYNVGWDGGHMIYCPPPAKRMSADILFDSQPPMTGRKCGDEEAITAQEYVDLVLGYRVATVIGVAPFMVRNSVYGVIYYKENTPRTDVDSK